MKAVLCLVLIGCATVFADNYLCPKHEGDLFECYEYGLTARACLTDGRGTSYVICSKCKRKWEFCASHGKYQESKHPERDCGDDYESTPCTKDNSEWFDKLKYKKE